MCSQRCMSIHPADLACLRTNPNGCEAANESTTRRARSIERCASRTQSFLVKRWRSPRARTLQEADVCQHGLTPLNINCLRVSPKWAHHPNKKSSDKRVS